MTEKECSMQKCIVDELNFGAKTSKRVSWEQFEFTIEAPHLVRVTNAAYGFEKDDHSYLVGIEDRDGLLVPAECECKADMFREDYDCKHKVALATVGGPVVLQAAVDYSTPTVGTERSPIQTLEDKLRADGGTVTEEPVKDTSTLDAEEQEECTDGNEWCPGSKGDDLPCFACFERTEGQ